MKIENAQVFGFDAAVRAMRNPMNSWDKSDTPVGSQVMGEVDSKLAIKLILAGKDHRKFLRCIHIQVDLTLPRYIWTELDTYKIATTRVSCSTMHKLGSVDLDASDFQDGVFEQATVDKINHLAAAYRASKNVDTLRAMKQILPEGFLQKATFDFSYETAMNIYHARKNHRMTEWHTLCDWLETLPMLGEWLKLEN